MGTENRIVIQNLHRTYAIDILGGRLLKFDMYMKKNKYRY